MTAPAISIVMPVRDAAATLPAALDSVLRPDRAGLGAARHRRRLHRRLVRGPGRPQRDPRVRILHASRRGLVPALNAGVEAATAPLIARLDADDVCADERLAQQRRYLDAHPGTGLAASRVSFGGDPIRAAGYARHVAWTNRLLTHEAIALGRFVESPLAHPSVMFRREVVERWGGYADGDFPEDYELWLRWLEAGVRMDKLPATLLTWNDSATRLSRHDPRYTPDAFYRVKARYLARWLASNNLHHPSVTLWGAGRVTRNRARHLLSHGVTVEAFIDIDPCKVGRAIAGRRVVDPAALPPPGRAFVVSYVSSAGARAQIEASLRARGYRPGHDYILAA